MDKFKYTKEPLTADDFAARSTKQPVHKLSPELLSNIFIEYAALLPHPPMQRSLCPAYLKWIAATYVCRYWRSVALGCTTLWRRLVFFNPEVTKEMIRRSKGSNLEVRIRGHIPQNISAAVDEALRMVIPELHHVSILHLELYKNVLQPLVEGFASAAPNLESLSLLLRWSYGKVHVPDDIRSENARFTLSRA
jgi:F-box-like